MMHGQHYGKWLMVSVMLSSSMIVMAAEQPMKGKGAAYAAEWECRAFSGGDWLCRASASNEYTVPLDTIAAMRPSIDNTLSALKLLRQSSAGHPATVPATSRTIEQSDQSGDVSGRANPFPTLSLSPDARKLIIMLQREEAYTILWYTGHDKVEATRMREAVGQIEDSLLLVSDHQGLKEYVIVSGLFPDAEAAQRDLNTMHLDGSLAFLRPSLRQVRDLSSRTISLP